MRATGRPRRLASPGATNDLQIIHASRTGFVLDQSELIEDLPEEAIEPGRFVVRQKRIRQIESKLDIAFGVIGDWDQMGSPDPNESLDDDGIVVTSLNDIRGAKPK